jgi:hypothetical protein
MIYIQDSISHNELFFCKGWERSQITMYILKKMGGGCLK